MIFGKPKSVDTILAGISTQVQQLKEAAGHHGAKVEEHAALASAHRIERDRASKVAARFEDLIS